MPHRCLRTGIVPRGAVATDPPRFAGAGPRSVAVYCGAMLLHVMGSNPSAGFALGGDWDAGERGSLP